MRDARPSWLLRAALFAGASVIPVFSSHNTRTARSALATVARCAQMCATQTEDLADHRIAACSILLGTGRLHGEPQASPTRCADLPISTAATSRAPSATHSAVALAPDFAPAYQNRGNAGMRAAITVRPWPTTTPRSGSTPPRLAFVNRARCARSRNTDGALEDSPRRSASIRATPAPIALAASSICARRYGARQPISTMRSGCHRARRLHAAGEGARGIRQFDQALADYHEASRLDPSACRP